jgi:hypothetical protein
LDEVAYVAKIDVEVTFVVVAFVKIAAAGVVRPIVVPLIVPPVKMTLPLERFVTVPFVISAFVAKRFVEVVLVPVALVHVMLVGDKLLILKFVKTPSVAKMRLPVAFVKLSAPTVEDPAAKLPVRTSVEPVAFTNVAFGRTISEAVIVMDAPGREMSPSP